MRFLISFICIALLTFTGCGKSPNPDGRLNVSGKITLNGGSFPGAEMCGIAMIPLDDKSAGNSSTTFNRETGEYLFTRQDGLKPGRHKVMITASAIFDRKTKKPITSETLEGYDYRVDLVPKEFNKNSTIEFEVKSGQENVFNYDVKTELNAQTKPNKAALPN